MPMAHVAAPNIAIPHRTNEVPVQAHTWAQHHQLLCMFHNSKSSPHLLLRMRGNTRRGKSASHVTATWISRVLTKAQRVCLELEFSPSFPFSTITRH